PGAGAAVAGERRRERWPSRSQGGAARAFPASRGLCRDVLRLSLRRRHGDARGRAAGAALLARLRGGPRALAVRHVPRPLADPRLRADDHDVRPRLARAGAFARAPGVHHVPPPAVIATSTTTTCAPPPALVELLRGRRVVVLAGAGCSTESGIPDYRGPQSVGRVRKPMTFQEFMGSDAARARYWARSAVGWRRIATARPNPAHRALARLEEGGVVRGIITQNVDGLHHAAGSRRVVELHGSLSRVRCL